MIHAIKHFLAQLYKIYKSWYVVGLQDNQKELLDMYELGRANIMVDDLAKRFRQDIKSTYITHIKVVIHWVR